MNNFAQRELNFTTSLEEGKGKQMCLMHVSLSNLLANLLKFRMMGALIATKYHRDNLNDAVLKHKMVKV